METIAKNAIILQAIKTIVWAFIIPIAIYSNFGLASIFGYIVVMAAIHNFIIRQHTVLAFAFVVSGMLIVGYYIVLLFMLIIGALTAIAGA